MKWITGRFWWTTTCSSPPASARNWSHGGALCPQSFRRDAWRSTNMTPARRRSHKPHSTDAGRIPRQSARRRPLLQQPVCGRADLSQYDDAKLPVWMDGNVFLNGAKPSKYEAAPLVQSEIVPAPKLIQEADGWYLEMKYAPTWTTERTRQTVTTKLLGPGRHSERRLRATGWRDDSHQHRLLRPAPEPIKSSAGTV